MKVISTVQVWRGFKVRHDTGFHVDVRICIPLSLISAFVLKAPLTTVYVLMYTDEFAKMPFAIYHYLNKGCN